MTDIQTLQTYENWKSAKKKRKFWIKIIAMLAGLLLAYITVTLFVSRCGLTGAKKVFKYATINIEDEKKRQELPTDYLTWYKDRKMDETYVSKKLFTNKPEDFTYEEIAKKKAKKAGEDWFGELGGKLAEWFASQGIDESKKKEVDWVSYARSVYAASNMAFWLGNILFWLIFWLILRFIVLPLCWKEPKLVE